jgi:hypothetical protein
MPEKQTSDNPNPDLRFQMIEEWIYEQISNIAENNEKSISDFLKPHIREIVEKYPKELRTEFKFTEKHHMRANGVSGEVAKEFDTLVKNFGGNPSYFMKMHLYEIIQKYPEKQRKRFD